MPTGWDQGAATASAVVGSLEEEQTTLWVDATVVRHLEVASFEAVPLAFQETGGLSGLGHTACYIADFQSAVGKATAAPEVTAPGRPLYASVPSELSSRLLIA